MSAETELVDFTNTDHANCKGVKCKSSASSCHPSKNGYRTSQKYWYSFFVCFKKFYWNKKSLHL